MTDPVVAADGYTCERAALQKCMQFSIESPVTGHQLSDRRVVHNCIIAGVIP